MIELNRADADVWFEVTAGNGGPVPLWTDAERDTLPVLDIDAIRVPETAEIYRRLLTEGDGSRDELLELAAAVRLDVDAAPPRTDSRALWWCDRCRVPRASLPGRLRRRAGLDRRRVRRGDRTAATAVPAVGWWTAVRETAIAGVGGVHASHAVGNARSRGSARLSAAVPWSASPCRSGSSPRERG